jgi:hypothetical protein
MKLFHSSQSGLVSLRLSMGMAGLLALAGSVSAQTLYRFGVGPGRAETVVRLMPRDASSFLVQIRTGAGAGNLHFSLANLQANQPGIYTQWTTFGPSIAPGSSGGTQYYGTNTINANSYNPAYSSLSGAPTVFSFQGGNVSLGRGGFTDGNTRELANFVAIGNSRATGVSRPWVYRPASTSAPFQYLAMPLGFTDATTEYVSDDGRWSFGTATTTGAARLVVWDGTTVATTVNYPTGFVWRDANADGTAALGQVGQQPVLVSNTGVITQLGLIPGAISVVARSISGDGQIVVGSSAFGSIGGWVWTSAGGYQSADSLFGQYFPSDATITALTHLSADGRTVAGQVSTSLGIEAFVLTNVTIPAPGASALMGLGLVAWSRRRR